MKLSMMSCMMGNVTPVEIVRTALACGMEAIDWVCSNTYATAAELRKLSLDNGLKIIAHTVLGSRFVERGQGALDDFKKSLEFASVLGAPTMMLPPFPRVRQISMVDDRKAWTEFYAQVLPLAQSAGVTLTLESTGMCNSPITTVSEVLEVLHAVPGLMCTLDVGNMETAEPSGNAYSLLKEYVVQLHLKDWKITERPVPGADLKRCGKYFSNVVIGEGDLDLKAFWNTVDVKGKELYVNVETMDFAGTTSNAEVMKRTADFLRNW